MVKFSKRTVTQYHRNGEVLFSLKERPPEIWFRWPDWDVPATGSHGSAKYESILTKLIKQKPRVLGNADVNVRNGQNYKDATMRRPVHSKKVSKMLVVRHKQPWNH
ncbi:hypothetical protein QQP08_015291 [Theobroma cacao]|nr:hypothetical protein QQP08_015291 [Theobroma cacao]